MLVGEAPGAEEALSGRPFAGASGWELNSELAAAGWSRDQLFITNVCHERPPGNEIEKFFAKRAEARHAVQLDGNLLHAAALATLSDLPLAFISGRYPRGPILIGLRQLQKDIDALRPRLIIAMGNTALWALTGHTGIRSWRGSIIEASGGPVDGHGIKLIPTVHTASVLREYPWRGPVIQDLRRAKKEAAFPEIRRPKWAFTVPSTVNQLIDWIDTNVKPLPEDAPIAADVENDYDTDRVHDARIFCLGMAVNSTTACCVPMVHRTGPSPHWWPSAAAERDAVMLLREVLRSRPVIFHNGLHDCQVIAHNWGWMPRFEHDTMVGQHVMFPAQLGGKIDPITGKTAKSGSSYSLLFCSSMYCQYHKYWKDDGKGWDPAIHDEMQYWHYNCLTGDTKVLTSDCQWKRLDQITIGDELLSVDEEQPREDLLALNKTTKQNYARKLRTTEVTRVACANRPILKITLSDGAEIKCTGEHKFLVQQFRKNGKKIEKVGAKWIEAKDITLGDFLSSMPVWEEPASPEAFWMGGFLDEEGTIGAVYHRTGANLIRPSFSQKEGPVLDKARDIASAFNFNWRSAYKSSAVYTDVNGGLGECIRFLGVFPNLRLVERLKRGARTHGWSGFHSLPRKSVIKIEPWGSDVVYDISTTLRTFIANGVVVHNCEDLVRTYEVHCALRNMLVNHNLIDQYNFLMSLFPEVFEMMFDGLAFNTKARLQYRFEVKKQVRMLQAWVDTAVGHPLNVRSTGPGQQMQKLFYDDFGLQKVLHRKTKHPTLNDDALELFKKRKPILRPLIERIQAIRSLGVFKENFLDVRLTKADHRLRSAINVAGPETYRFSMNVNALSEGTNLQNLPRIEE